MKRNIIAILEDNPQRLSEMNSCVTQLLPHARCIFFDNSYEMINWLRKGLRSVILISLDHDLALCNELGEVVDNGNGRQVADYLATRRLKCPVIVHSSNEIGGTGMFFALKDAGWSVFRVRPFEDCKWIRQTWKDQVMQHFSDGRIAAS